MTQCRWIKHASGKDKHGRPLTDGACTNWAESFFSRMRRGDVEAVGRLVVYALHLKTGMQAAPR